MIENGYLPTEASISKHEAPGWYNDAKLGIFVHWGLYSVPAWAVKGSGFHEVLKKHGAAYWFRNNGYAEWYWNSLKIRKSGTQVYHKEMYGEDFDYTDFASEFETAIEPFNARVWAEIFKQAGARYAILTSKHHDGYLLWNSRHPNPHQPNFQAKRDLIGEFTDAMRGEGIRVGIYYSGGPDWIFEPHPIEDLTDLMVNIPKSEEYAKYVLNHYRELIERYHPDILWNDINFPKKAELYDLLAEFYNQNPEGVVNDRFRQIPFGEIPNLRMVKNLLNRALEGALKKGVDILGFNNPPAIGDFSTPEYMQLNEIASYKWETCRGLGKSFGYNQLEDDSDLIDSSSLIRLLVDIVSKNGNLLINVGPEADGSIPEIQKKRLILLGRWLAVKGECIYGSRPWIQAEGQSLDGVPLRFTQNKGKIYLFAMEKIQGESLCLEYPERVESIFHVGTNRQFRFKRNQNIIEIYIGDREFLIDEDVPVFCIE